MTPEEIMAAYDVLAQEGNNYAAQEAAKIGNSQASLGLMAERVARPSGMTSGLANYTYNRILRPTVDTLAASLITTGKTQAMDRYLKDKLMAAKNNYEDAKNNYTIASTTPRSGGGNGNNNYREQTDSEYNLQGDATSEQEAADKAAKKKQIQQNMNDMQTGAKRYYYVQNGQKVPFTVYNNVLGGGLEVDGGMSYTMKGGQNFINQLRKNGARIYDAQFNTDVTNQLLFLAGGL